MADTNLALTTAGQALKAKIEMGGGTIPLEITRIVTASGTSPDPLNLTAVVNEQQTFTITGRTTTGPRTEITAILTNMGNPGASPPIPPLASGYALSQIGWYAIDPDDGEILYRISQFDAPNYVPAASERGWTYEPTFNIITGNASEVIVQIDPSGFTSMQDIWNSIELSGQDVQGASTRIQFREADDAPGYTPVSPITLYNGAKITEIRLFQDPANPAGNYVQIALPITVLEAIMNQITGQSLAEMLELTPEGTFGFVEGLKNHTEEAVASENGIHGMRYWDDMLQIWDGAEWVDVATGDPQPSTGTFSVDANGVLANTTPFGNVSPNAKGLTLTFMPGFASASGTTLNLV